MTILEDLIQQTNSKRINGHIDLTIKLTLSIETTHKLEEKTSNLGEYLSKFIEESVRKGML